MILEKSISNEGMFSSETSSALYGSWVQVTVARLRAEERWWVRSLVVPPSVSGRLSVAGVVSWCCW